MQRMGEGFAKGLSHILLWMFHRMHPETGKRVCYRCVVYTAVGVSHDACRDWEKGLLKVCGCFTGCM